MIVSLYTSRIILDYLGATDYGIYNVVGGIVLLFSFLSNSMTLSTQRFLAFEIGSKTSSLKRINTIFSMAVSIHIILAIIIFIICESIGSILFNQLTIPIERYEAAKWVLQLSIIASCISILQIPYTAIIISYEKMDAYAYISIIEVILKLIIVFTIPIIQFDKLIVYACLILGANLTIQLLYILYCKTRISHIQYSKVWDKKLFKELLMFSSWSLLGELSWSGVNQGVNIILNIFFNPVINAARAITMQVLVTINQFVTNFQTALNPQIIKLYSNEQYKEMFTLTFRGIRFSFFLMLFISFPLILNMKYLLSLWLKNVPDYTDTFCQLAIIGALCDIFSNLLATIVKANGNIKLYQLIVSFVLFLNLPISYLLLKLNFSPTSVYIVYIFISIILIYTRIILLNQIINFPYTEYFKEVLSPILKTIIIGIPIPIIIHHSINLGLTGTFISIMCSLLCIGFTIFFIGLKQTEKKFLLNKLKR